LRSYSTDYRYFSAAGFSMGEGSDNQRVARQWGQPELRGGLHLTPVGTTPAGLAAALLQGCGLPHGSVGQAWLAPENLVDSGDWCF